MQREYPAVISYRPQSGICEGRNGMVEMIEGLLAAASKEELFGALARHCAELGFSHFIYTPLIGSANAEKVFKDESRVFGKHDLIEQNMLPNCPVPWINRYQEARHVEHDPVIKHVSRSILPIFWDDASAAHPGNIVFDEAREHGLAYGITIPILAQGGQRAVFSVSTDRIPVQSKTQRVITAGLVQLTANYVHEAIQKLASGPHAQAFPALSVREKECLQWAANGKTSWEIGQILCIAERTVIFHLSNAARKLNATNRRQAVVRALTLRLINS